MDHKAKFTEVKQARQVKSEVTCTFLNLQHTSEHVDLVISGMG